MKAKFLHPDTKETGNEEAYKRLQAAYATLKERRQP
jgi:curved DNA-binding protein CbpA